MSAINRRNWLLLCLVALGAAGMFLAPSGWLGLDLGPAASVLLYTALWLGVMHVSRYSNGAFPEGAPLAERQAWVGVAFVTLIALHYLNFLSALPGLGAEADRISNSASRPFGINLGMLMFGWIVVAGAVRKQNQEVVELDERDLRIQHASGRFANGLMSLLIIGLIVSLAWFPETAQRWMRPLIVGNALIGLLIVRTLSENLYAVARYWRERQ
jgi:hypothetical protein